MKNGLSQMAEEEFNWDAAAMNTFGTNWKTECELDKSLQPGNKNLLQSPEEWKVHINIIYIFADALLAV